MRVVQIDLTGALTGVADSILMWSDLIAPDGVMFFDCPDDYTSDKYNYIPAISGVFDPNGFVVKQVIDSINFGKRQSNIQSMNNYMASFIGVPNGITQASFDLFLSDTSALVQQYLSGGGRLITWIETTSRNGYNATTNGFKIKGGYRGDSINGIVGKDGLYPRAEQILQYLNDL